jgi:hypothetical protein
VYVKQEAKLNEMKDTLNTIKKSNARIGIAYAVKLIQVSFFKRKTPKNIESELLTAPKPKL